jgi:hypothetical protein
MTTGEIIFPCSSEKDLAAKYDSTYSFMHYFGRKKQYPPINDKRIEQGSMRFRIDYSQLQNNFSASRDNQDNIYIVFNIQNRIEKYTSDGTLILRANRKLNYEESTKPEMRNTVLMMGKERNIVKAPGYNSISSGSGIDRFARLWAFTNKYQPDLAEESDPSLYMHFEIFDSDGILLGYLPLPAVNTVNFRIFNDRMYFIDISNEMCVYEYKIVEK